MVHEYQYFRYFLSFRAIHLSLTTTYSSWGNQFLQSFPKGFLCYKRDLLQIFPWYFYKPSYLNFKHLCRKCFRNSTFPKCMVYKSSSLSGYILIREINMFYQITIVCCFFPSWWIRWRQKNWLYLTRNLYFFFFLVCYIRLLWSHLITNRCNLLNF